MKTYRVIDIHEKDFGCEEVPEGMSHMQVVVLEDTADKKKTTLELNEWQLDEGGDIQEGDIVTLGDGNKVKKVK